jgi:hypothetical protein
MEAAKHTFYNTGTVTVSPDNKLLCFTEDTVGGEKYVARVIELATRQSVLQEPIEDCSGNVVWAADSRTLFYVKQDRKMRPFQVRHSRCTSAVLAPQGRMPRMPNCILGLARAVSFHATTAMLASTAPLTGRTESTHGSGEDVM